MLDKALKVIDFACDTIEDGKIERILKNGVEYFVLINIKNKGEYISLETGQVIMDISLKGLIDKLRDDNIFLIDFETKKLL